MSVESNDDKVYGLVDHKVHKVMNAEELWGTEEFSMVEDPSHSIGGVKTKGKPKFWHIEHFGVRRVWEDMKTQGEGVTVAVLDTGVDSSHPDLKGVLSNSCDYTKVGRDPKDNNGHGTHCCGIIASVAPRAAIRSFKVFGPDEKAVHSNIIRSLQDIEGGKHGNIRIINMSLGSGEPSEEMRTVLLRMCAKGYLVVCAAGNEADHTSDGAPRFGTINWPAHFNSTIAVGSVNKNRVRSPYSSSGPKITVMAPGENVTSCWKDGTYAVLSGTSMASPFVSGCLALLLSYCDKHKLPDPVIHTVLWSMASSCCDLESPGFNFFTGYGCINPKGLINRYRELCESQSRLKGVGKCNSSVVACTSPRVYDREP